jgi:hypothetical protein
LGSINGQINAVIMYWVHDYGNKIGIVATDGNDDSKEMMYNKLQELINSEGWFVELSGALDHVMANKRNVKNVTNQETIKKIIGVGDINQDGSYERLINDKPYRKKLFGIPCKKVVRNKVCGVMNIC